MRNPTDPSDTDFVLFFYLDAKIFSQNLKTMTKFFSSIS